MADVPFASEVLTIARPGAVSEKMKDMGDGTHARVIAVAAASDLDPPLTTATALTPANSGTTPAGRMLSVKCTNAGDVSVLLSGGSTFIFGVTVGQSFFPFAVTRVNITGTTATATYASMT